MSLMFWAETVQANEIAAGIVQGSVNREYGIHNFPTLQRVASLLRTPQED